MDGRRIFSSHMLVMLAGLGWLMAPSVAPAQEPVAPGAAPPTQDARTILREARPRAIDQILASIRSDDPMLRAHAIEAIEPDPQRALPLVQVGLEDANPGVRFVALVTAGKLELQSLRDAARRHAEDENESVRAAALFAVYRCGGQIDLSPLAELMARPDPVVRGNVAMLLGLMGEKSAAPMLVDLSSVPMRRVSDVRAAIVRIQVAEALALLGKDDALDAIRAGAFSVYDEVRIIAVQMMGRLGDQRMAQAIVRMLDDPPVELQLAAAEALARFGRRDGLEVALNASRATLPMQRVQAAFTLGQMRDARAVARLTQMLDDPEEVARLAAAAAILQAAAAH